MSEEEKRQRLLAIAHTIYDLLPDDKKVEANARAERLLKEQEASREQG